MFAAQETLMMNDKKNKKMKKCFSFDFSFSNLSKEKEDHPIIDVLRDWSAHVVIKKRKKTKKDKIWKKTKIYKDCWSTIIDISLTIKFLICSKYGQFSTEKLLAF